MAQNVYKSEIRDSTKNELLEKVEKRNYEKYLYKIYLKQIRGFSDVAISLDFPVTAIIGRNGSGKTTVLGAAACLYDTIKPRQFFARNSALDTSMQGWRIEYEAIDKKVNSREIVKRTVSFNTSKWSRDALKRQVAFFGVIRTLPASERIELKRLASNTFDLGKALVEKIPEVVGLSVAKILDKDITNFSHVKIDKIGRVSLLSGITKKGAQYSEFHFGAGESSVIRMVMRLESLPDSSLVVIEEIENGLHPVATIRMVEYLIELAKRKNLQTIFSTHSNDALRILPSKAIWSIEDSIAKQGHLDVHSLRNITATVESKVSIFVEDDFSQVWLEYIIRRKQKDGGDDIHVYPLGGDSKAYSTHKAHCENPASKTQSLCLVDGDAQLPDEAWKFAGVYKLPGQSPEAYIFDSIIDKIDEVSARLTIALHLDLHEQTKLEAYIKEVRRTNRDPHLLFEQLGEKLSFRSGNVIRGAFISTWIDAYPEVVQSIFEPIGELHKLEKIEVE